jgi:hypothetical protein
MEEVQKCNTGVVLRDLNTRLFGIYDRNGNIKSVYREPYDAFSEATKLNKQLGKDEYFIDWIIIN